MAYARRLAPVALLTALALPAAAVQSPRGDGPDWTFPMPAGVVATEVLALNLNGDIFPDLVVHVPTDAEPGRTWVFLGGRTLGTAPDFELGIDAVGVTDGASDAFGSWGDIDGDGFDDQLTWVGDPTDRHRTLQMRRGSADGIDVQPVTVTIDDYRVPSVFGHLVPVGPIVDQNGDGFGDVSLRAPERDGIGTRAHLEVHMGTATGVDRRPAWAYSVDGAEVVAGRQTIIGDADGDGLRELAHLNDYPDDGGTWHASLVILKGDPDGPRDSYWASQLIDHPVAGPGRVHIVATGDVNGDSADDIVLLIHPGLEGEPDRLIAILGDANYATRLGNPPTIWTSDGTGTPPAFFGLADMNNDLELDYVVGSAGRESGGTAYGGVDLAFNELGSFRAANRLDFLALGTDRGAGIAGAFADFDGDLRADLMVSVAGDETHPGSLQLMLGFFDADLDGADDASEDCNPRDATIHPGAEEVWYDGIDQDCDGNDDDQDEDGARADGRGGNDCDDLDATISPRATDIPGNGIDENCDGVDAALTGPGDVDIVKNADCGGCSTGGTPAGGLFAAMLGLLALRRRSED